MERLDVAILGGGMAGSLLARQLLRSAPELRVGLFERTHERGHRVGESTVEIGSNYLVRRLGLSRYLYEHHLPKNGLRYFFDSPERDLPLPEMSEIGSWGLPFHPAFQIDRARFDTDLLRMVTEAGARVRIGARVHDVELGTEGGSHHFRVEEDGRSESWESRWLIDATGRSALVARAQGLRVKDVDHRVASTWGRFEGVADIDDMGSDEFRSRVRHTSRGISTLHFCYAGYWIWFIPIKNGMTSIGVVGEPPREARLRTPEGFRAFLDEHAAIREMLRAAKTIDVGSNARLAFGTRSFLSPDRWAMTGESAAFADPLYSPGTDFIALENDFVTDAIVRDTGGESQPDVAERIDLYDRFLHFRFEAAMLLYRGQYGLLGSAELMRLKWDFDLGLYYNLWVSSYMQDQHLDAAWLRRELRQERFVLQAMRNFSGLFQTAEEELRKQGEYWRANRGQFSYGLEHIDFVEEVGQPHTRRQVLEKTGEIFNSVYLRTLEVLGKSEDGPPAEPLPLTSFMVDRPLA
ncbi:MAG: NAD(P)/FAD-dependent oxidoreductase [Myxococcales bacterium]|nr:NAD(P)/FAD-dependent oxidoreductase [Myxococcales bacterium]